MAENNPRAMDPQEVRALKEAVRKISPTFFGPMFDVNFHGLDDGRSSYEQRQRRAFDLTVRHPIIQRAGIDSVVNAAKDKEWSDKHLSPHAKDALDGFIQEQEKLKKGTSK